MDYWSLSSRLQHIPSGVKAMLDSLLFHLHDADQQFDPSETNRRSFLSNIVKMWNSKNYRLYWHSFFFVYKNDHMNGTNDHCMSWNTHKRTVASHLICNKVSIGGWGHWCFMHMSQVEELSNLFSTISPSEELFFEMSVFI